MKKRSAVLGCLVFLLIFSGCSVLADERFVPVASNLETIIPTTTPFQPSAKTATVTNTPTITVTPSPTSPLPPTSSPTALNNQFNAYDLRDLPPNAEIEDIKGWTPAFSLSCESRSAVDWAAYFGTQIREVDFQSQLPLSDDPNFGFVGDVNAAWGQIPPNPYGVHAGPVADLLNELGVTAKAVYGMTWGDLRAEISKGNPVIVWVVGRVARGTMVPYTSSNGDETTVARFEHTVIVFGYSKEDVSILDGQWVYTRPIGDFLDSWQVLGNMAIVRDK